MIKVEKLSAGYGGKPIVKDISFHVSHGEKVCIIGPNGSGKSTLLKAIVGLLDYQGSVKIKGTELKDYKRIDIAKNIGFLSQINDAYFSYSVKETVALGRYARGAGNLFSRTSKEDEKILEESMEIVGVTKLQDREITDLSGGELQRVFLAKVFAQTPEIILLDEPTNHLDLKYQIELMNHMSSWVEGTEKAVVAILHDINLAFDFAHRILLLFHGELVFDGTKEELLNSKYLDTVYGMDVHSYMLGSLKQWKNEDRA